MSHFITKSALLKPLTASARVSLARPFSTTFVRCKFSFLPHSFTTPISLTSLSTRGAFFFISQATPAQPMENTKTLFLRPGVRLVLSHWTAPRHSTRCRALCSMRWTMLFSNSMPMRTLALSSLLEARRPLLVRTGDTNARAFVHNAYVPPLHLAGADIKEMKDNVAIECYKNNFLGHWTDITKVKKPILAAVNGFAVRVVYVHKRGKLTPKLTLFNSSLEEVANLPWCAM